MMAGIIMLLLVAAPGGPIQAREPVNESLKPSQELLEFLGEWTTDNGELLTPADLEKMPLPAEENKDEHPDK